MDFLRPEFENAINPFVEGDVVMIGRFAYTGVDIIKLAGDEAYKQAFNDWIWEDWIPGRRERKDEILALPANATRYEELKQVIKCGRAIPFVGSGMSCPTGMPTWVRFLRETRKQARGFTAQQLETLLKTGRFETAATRIFDAMPSRLFNERFEASFVLKSGKPIKGPVQLLPYLFNSIAITTNFDGILEKAYGNAGQTFQVILYGTGVGDYRKKVSAGTRCLLKLHGNYAETHSRVLTKKEYDAFYKKNSSGREELSFIFRGGGLIFLGCSLRQDRTMDLLEKISDTDENMPRHCALLQQPKTKRETQNREHFLAKRNVFPIWYDGEHDTDIEALIVGLMEDLKKF
jgi:hypothetical protein